VSAATAQEVKNLSDITADPGEQAVLDVYEDACATITSLLEELERVRRMRDSVKSRAEYAIVEHNKRVAARVRAQYVGVNPETVLYAGVGYPVTRLGQDRMRMVRGVVSRAKGMTQAEQSEAAARAGLKAEGYVLPVEGRDK
jgi:hypothetical protein